MWQRLRAGPAEGDSVGGFPSHAALRLGEAGVRGQRAGGRGGGAETGASEGGPHALLLLPQLRVGGADMLTSWAAGPAARFPEGLACRPCT